MRFTRSVEIHADRERVWEVLSDLQGWATRIETVERVEVLGPLPLAAGSRVRLKQPKLPEGLWEITVWERPRFFEWRQKSGGVTSTAGHEITELGEGRCRLDLSLDMRGLLVPVVARLSKGLIERYMATEAESIKRAAESPGAGPDSSAPSGP